MVTTSVCGVDCALVGAPACQKRMVKTMKQDQSQNEDSHTQSIAKLK